MCATIRRAGLRAHRIWITPHPGIWFTSFAIWRQHFPEFKIIVRANYLSTFCPTPEASKHLNKRVTAYSNALCPFVHFDTIVSLDCAFHLFAVSIF